MESTSHRLFTESFQQHITSRTGISGTCIDSGDTVDCVGLILYSKGHDDHGIVGTGEMVSRKRRRTNEEKGSVALSGTVRDFPLRRCDLEAAGGDSLTHKSAACRLHEAWETWPTSRRPRS
ncbi:hypothetical protein B7494_g8023 [Chlorociboria aeruginascens]|nr:hypothetical protein B7494_g8023 [Chlorociboria aeruginascens]